MCGTTCDPCRGIDGAFVRIGGTAPESIVDGPGWRYAVFFQGCLLRCPGCHNPQTHDPDGGRVVPIAELTGEMGRNPLLQGVTLSGGEPFLQPNAAAEIAKAARRMSLDVWCYTGMTWEAVSAPDAPPEWRELLGHIDVLADGPFLLEQRTLELMWRGSANQRLIDVAKSLRSGVLVDYII